MPLNTRTLERKSSDPLPGEQTEPRREARAAHPAAGNSCVQDAGDAGAKGAHSGRELIQNGAVPRLGIAKETLAHGDLVSERANGASCAGMVYLVGAGPGDPGLLTLRAAELLHNAEVLAYDALIPPALLALAAADAERLPVGHRHGEVRKGDRIHPLVIDRARAGKHVVRLKCGDPMLFARGGEEAQALAEAGVPFQIVPGITAALAAASAAGIPLTHRGLSSSLSLATGHAAAEAQIRWPPWKAERTTLALYMAARRIQENVHALLAAGYPPGTPAACVSAAYWPQQQILRSALSELPRQVATLDPHLPALLLVGSVTRLGASQIQGLRGRRIVLARARPGRSQIARALRALGAWVIELPQLRAIPQLPAHAPHDWEARLARVDGLIFACAEAVPLAQELGLRVAQTETCTLAAVGSSAQHALEAAAWSPQVICRGACAEALQEHAEFWRGRRFLLCTAQQGRPQLVRELQALHAHVETLPLYTLQRYGTPPQATWAELLVLPSSSAVQGLLELWPEAVALPAVAMGPHTEHSARSAGMQVQRCAEDTIPALLACVQEVLGAAHEASRGCWAQALPPIPNETSHRETHRLAGTAQKETPKAGVV